MHHPVVAGLQQHVTAVPDLLAGGIDGAHIGLEQADAAHGLVHGGGAQGGQAVSSSAVGALDIAVDNSQFVHGNTSLL
jgi:hypothetical protein